MPSIRQNQRSPCSHLRLLLVEDSARLCEMLRDMLNDLDHVQVVADAADEEHALELLRANPVDLIIVDLELRTGSGLGVLKHIEAEPTTYGQPQAVVFSNYGHEVLRSRCRALGVRHFFDKSFQLDDLLDYVQTQADDLMTADRH